jgi:hypothetical protein
MFPLEAAAELLREMADASGLYLQAVLFRGSRSTRLKEDSGGTTRIS